MHFEDDRPIRFVQVFRWRDFTASRFRIAFAAAAWAAAACAGSGPDAGVEPATCWSGTPVHVVPRPEAYLFQQSTHYFPETHPKTGGVRRLELLRGPSLCWRTRQDRSQDSLHEIPKCGMMFGLAIKFPMCAPRRLPTAGPAAAAAAAAAGSASSY
jgi:hypothetical protein